PTKYRDVGEVSAWKALDPIDRFGKYLRTKSWWDDKRQAEMEARLARDLDAAVKEAEAAGPPGAETLVDDVFAAVPPYLEEQRRALLDEIASRQGHAGGVGEFPL
ncbi:MAG: 3-methyl-2-oxobutanoate dehydrogenase, partial [Planctomycetes bacterium]|nr:3-methyl-2-oxobutanoate dehydrogenase [Planctomycetota bacterium]